MANTTNKNSEITISMVNTGVERRCGRDRSVVNTNDNQNDMMDVDTDDEVVIVEPEKRACVVVDLTCDEAYDEAYDEDSNINNVYVNVTMLLTPGGGYHIKWNE